MPAYVYGSNMPGYMPDETPDATDTLEHAKECLAESITHYLEDLNLDDRYTDAQVKEHTSTLAAFDAAPPQECNVYIGDRVFWITAE